MPNGKAYDELMKSVEKRVESGAQARDEENDRKRKQEEEERQRKAEAERRAKEGEKATGDRVKEGLRRWINPDMFRKGGAADEMRLERGRQTGRRG